jgi:bifunctional NMN adenylyltransferase/nudix hydrolase
MATKTAVYIGRFRPFHHAHYITARKALSENDELVIFVGSCGKPRDIKNPFVFSEIEVMIRLCFSEEENKSIKVIPLMDHMYDNLKWIAQVQKAAAENITGDIVTIYGHMKDSSSFYLSLFPEWEFKDVGNVTDIHATEIRDLMFKRDNREANWHLLSSKVDKEVYLFLKAFRGTKEFEKLDDEYEFIKMYRKSWEDAPYAPTFVTVDAVVECMGYILMIKRKATPGKGLWALPGGFIGANEMIEDAVIRELKEETKIKVSRNFLKGCQVSKEIFDHPGRSLRGRTITHAYYYKLQQYELPEVKGADDAAEAKWFTLSEIQRMEGVIFEDHLDIICHMTGITKEWVI